MPKDLDELATKKGEYDKPSQEIIESLLLTKAEIAAMESMRRTEGWQILEKKIREELCNRIEEMVAEDKKIQTLMALLKLSDTKKRKANLHAEISKFLEE